MTVYSITACGRCAAPLADTICGDPSNRIHRCDLLTLMVNWPLERKMSTSWPPPPLQVSVRTCWWLQLYLLSRHMRCLRTSLVYDDRTRSRTLKSCCQLLQICSVTGIEAILMSAQLRWVGQWSTSDPQNSLLHRAWAWNSIQGWSGQLKRYEDMHTEVKHENLQSEAWWAWDPHVQWSSWRSLVKKRLSVFEGSCVQSLQD